MPEYKAYVNQKTEIQGRKERRLGAAFGMVHIGISSCSRMVLVPIILHFLDKGEFGLYQLIGSLVGYLALIDFGISNTLSRFTARFQTLEDRMKQENLFAMCLLIYAILAMMLTVIGRYLYANLGYFFSKTLTVQELADAKIMFVILLGSVSATVLGKAFIGINAGYERFIFPRITSSVCEIVKVIAIAAVLLLGRRAIGIVCVEALINILVLLANAAYALMILKIRIKIHYWDWTLFSELVRFAFWTFLAALVIQINYRLGNVLLGVMATTSLVGVYAIALQINTLYTTVSTMISNVFLPQITRLVVAGADGMELTKGVISPSRYQLMTVGCIMGGFFLFGRQFITLWAGDGYVDAWGVALFILVPVTVPVCQNTIVTILYAKMMNKGRALINLTFACLSGVCAYLLIPRFGLYGAAFATGMALLLGQGISLNLYYKFRVGLDMPYFYRKVSEKIFRTIVSVTAACILLRYLPVGAGWGGFFIRLNLFLLIYCAAMWKFGMKKNERGFVAEIYQSVAKKMALVFRWNEAKI